MLQETVRAVTTVLKSVKICKKSVTHRIRLVTKGQGLSVVAMFSEYDQRSEFRRYLPHEALQHTPQGTRLGPAAFVLSEDTNTEHGGPMRQVQRLFCLIYLVDFLSSSNSTVQ